LSTRLAADLQQLEATKRSYGPGCAAQGEHLLARLRAVKFEDAGSLIRFHDSLLFLRAFPQSVTVARLADKLLLSLEPQVKRLLALPSAAETLDDEAVSGIAGTTVSNAWTLELARQLVERHPKDIAAGNVDDRYRQMATILPNCIPLLDDDSYVEVDTPYLKWIDAASGGKDKKLQWCLYSFSNLSIPRRIRTSLYDALDVSVRWYLRSSSASRTRARRPVSRIFTHHAPLIQRKEVSLHAEMNSAPLPLRKLSRLEGEKIIAMAQDALAVRYRELQGSTYGAPNYVFQADAGRGVQLFLWGLDVEWRLPLRAYYCGFTLKNGVPINYFEAIGLFEWMEVGFNTFYAFREGETAWIYSKVLHLLHQLAGVKCISVYPYQIGQDNEEAIKSGAFWFYRKLRFRPGRPDLLAIVEREERKLACDPKHRTSPRTLRKLADGHIFFEFDGTPVGRWDAFSTRTLGLRVQRKMAAEFEGDAQKLRTAATSRLCRILGTTLARWNQQERITLSDFAVALMLAPDVPRWTPNEKRALSAIIRAKAGLDETRYLRLLQQHRRLRDALLALGSDPPQPSAEKRKEIKDSVTLW
jgi:hypothetical protein